MVRSSEIKFKTRSADDIIDLTPELQKIIEVIERIIPSDREYLHDETWHDGNGFSHLRSALIGPSLSVSFNNSQMTLGTWQQVVFMEFENRAHQRRVSLQIIGE